MHIYQQEQDLQGKNRALAIPVGFQVDKDIAMFSGQFSQVRNSFHTTLEYIIINLEIVVIMPLGNYSLQNCFGKMV